MNSPDHAISIFTAFLAGLVSFASPCVLPLVPVYISFITGVSLKELTSENSPKASRRAALINSIFFILGFSFVFVALGATASFIGRFLLDYMRWITMVGGGLVVLFGIHMTGIFRIGFLQNEKRARVSTKKFGYFGSFLIGVAFGAGWTPCVGPILGSILVLASTQESVWQGIILLSFYSAGIGIPLFAATLGISAFMSFFNKYKKWIHTVEVLSGVLLIVLGILLMTDKFSILTSKLAFLSPENTAEQKP